MTLNLATKSPNWQQHALEERNALEKVNRETCYSSHTHPLTGTQLEMELDCY